MVGAEALEFAIRCRHEAALALDRDRVGAVDLLAFQRMHFHAGDGGLPRMLLPAVLGQSRAVDHADDVRPGEDDGDLAGNKGAFAFRLVELLSHGMNLQKIYGFLNEKRF